MSYTITITEKRTVTKKVGKEWAVLGTQEVERERQYWEKGGEQTRIEEVRGYTPEIEKEVQEEREVLKQTVETLDLPLVIKAINGL